MKRRYTPSLRAKFLLIVLGGAVLPLAVFGLWLTNTAERSAQTLLQSRLDASLKQIVEGVSERWLAHRSALLSSCEGRSVQRALVAAPDAGPDTDGAAQDELNRRYASLSDVVAAATIRDSSGAVRWDVRLDEISRNENSSTEEPLVPVILPVHEIRTGSRIGVLEAQLRLSALIPESSVWGGVAGSLLAAFNPGTGAPLLPTPFDPSQLESGRFSYSGEPWVGRMVALHEPPLVLAIAAPLGPFIEPFSEAARRNLVLLLVVAAGGLTLATLMSWPVTRALASLVAAAERVSEGNLDEKVEASRSDEVGRLARAFNRMTASLRGTLSRLAQREALASVGEFAAGLAHEVRNPLTSMRVDLQRAEEKLPEDSEARTLIVDVLSQVDRVDQSVTGALRVARSGQIDRENVDLREPLAAAAHEAEPRFQARGGTLAPLDLPPQPLLVNGNSAALQQLFLNLLLNAADALEDGGQALVTVQVTDGRVSVHVRDDGRGIAPDALSHVFDPFYSTKPEGTGLGLAIAQRIAVAHGGSLTVRSEPGGGTRVSLELPLLRAPP
jgi:signal transduction histidine kinase